MRGGGCAAHVAVCGGGCTRRQEGLGYVRGSAASATRRVRLRMLGSGSAPAAPAMTGTAPRSVYASNRSSQLTPMSMPEIATKATPRALARAGEEGHAGRPVGGPSGLRSMLAPSGRRIKQHPIEADSNCNGKRMEFKDLTPEQQDIAHTCKTPEDMVPFPKKWVTSFQMPSSQTWRAAWTGVATIKSALRTTPNRIPSRLRCGISLWSFEATLRSVDNLSRPKAGM